MDTMNLSRVCGLLAWITVVSPVLANEGCKMDPFNTCFNEGFQLISQPSRIRAVCRKKNMAKAATCTAATKRRCEEELRQDLDTSGWMQGLQLFCDNADLLVRHSNCTSDIKPDLEKCVASLLQAFAQKMQKRNLTQMSDTRVIMQLTCEHKQDSQTCRDRMLAKSCPQKVRRTITEVSRLLNKPTCSFGRYLDQSPSVKITTVSPDPSTAATSGGHQLAILMVVISLVLL